MKDSFGRIIKSFVRIFIKRFLLFELFTYELKSLMSFIWYSHEVEKYQFGGLGSYRKSRPNSNVPGRSTLLTKLPQVSEPLLFKIIRRLHMVDDSYNKARR